MMTCRRCGTPTVRFTVDQRYCSICLREEAAKYAPKPRPEWLPTWRRAAIAKSLNGLPT